MPLPPRRPTVFRPRGPAEMQAIHKFWYEIRVAELGQQLDEADHEALELRDPLGGDGEVVALRTDTSVIGTAILIRCSHGGGLDHAALYDMAGLGPIHPNQTGILAGLAIARAHRRTGALFMLLVEVYRLALESGLHTLATDVDESCLGPMLDLGFLPWGSSFDDPERGRRYVLKLECCDVQHLAQMHSPLEGIARALRPADSKDSNQDDPD